MFSSHDYAIVCKPAQILLTQIFPFHYARVRTSTYHGFGLFFYFRILDHCHYGLFFSFYKNVTRYCFIMYSSLRTHLQSHGVVDGSRRKIAFIQATNLFAAEAIYRIFEVTLHASCNMSVKSYDMFTYHETSASNHSFY